jgi:hypothetical protein
LPWLRALLCAPALLVVLVVGETLVNEPSPAREGSFEPCPPKAPPGQNELGVRHPYKSQLWMDEVVPCEVEYVRTSVQVCRQHRTLTRSEMGSGCVIPKTYGYVMQDGAGLHYKIDFELNRLDPIPWPERLVLRTAERPVMATTLVLVLVGVPWILLRRSRRHGWVVVYGLYALAGCWQVFSFASLL